MRKIPTVFVRDNENMKLVTREVTEGCEWVMRGEGVPTEKFDGTACLVREGRFYKRHRVKEGKALPDGWLHWSFDPEQKSGHGWTPVTEGISADQYHVEAIEAMGGNPGLLDEGTYELVGPKVQGNPHNLEQHQLWKHGSNPLAPATPGYMRTWDGIRMMMQEAPLKEGVVFHHPDGRMAKAKRRDFGLPWPVKGGTS